LSRPSRSELIAGHPVLDLVKAGEGACAAADIQRTTGTEFGSDRQVVTEIARSRFLGDCGVFGWVLLRGLLCVDD
jgi:hypothetical protein